MKPFPMLTAALVTAFLYVLMFERDTLMSMAGRAPSQPQAQADSPRPLPPAQAPTQAAAQPEGHDDAVLASVVVLRSEARNLADTVLLHGQTEASRMVQVKAETSGRVISQPMQKGARVSQGQILCRIDEDVRPARLAEARARLAEARINFEAANRLKDKGFASQTRASAMAAALEAARAAVTTAEAELERTRIRAPFDGVLEADTAELGSLLQPGAPCATVLQLDPVRLVGHVPETQVDRITPGAEAGGRMTDGTRVRGRVSFVAKRADPLTRTFRVEVESPNPDLTLRAGQTVEILIRTGNRKAHLLPQSVLTLNDAGILGVRIVDEDRIVRFRPATILRDSSEGVWLAGLPERAEVIVVGQEYVVEGVRVAVTYRENGA